MKIAPVVLAVLVVLAVCAPTPAHAGWRIDRSLAIAQTVWKPNCGQLRLAYGDPLRVGSDEAAGGWAWKGNCSIGIDASKHYEFEQLCTIVLHEGGHVAGVEHNSRPGSVMFAEPLVIKTTARIAGRTVVAWDGVDKRCLNRGRPFLERHGLL